MLPPPFSSTLPYIFPLTFPRLYSLPLRARGGRGKGGGQGKEAEKRAEENSGEIGKKGSRANKGEYLTLATDP
jgi:hypothetical protein